MRESTSSSVRRSQGGSSLSILLVGVPCLLAAVGCLLVVSFSHDAIYAAESGEVSMSVDPTFDSEEKGLGPAWIAYAMARVSRGGSADPAPFEEELSARQALAEIWSELVEENDYEDEYLSDLSEIHRAGYLREYTWACIETRKPERDLDLDLDGFADWIQERLPNHRVQTWVKAMVRGGDRVVHIGRPAHAPYACEEFQN